MTLSQLKTVLCLQCYNRLAASAGSRRALTKSSLMKLLLISRVVSLSQHPPENLTKHWKHKKSVGNYLKARLPLRLRSFSSLGVIWIKQSVSVLQEGESWGEGREEKDDKYKHWVGTPMHLNLQEGIMVWRKEIPIFCFNRNLWNTVNLWLPFAFCREVNEVKSLGKRNQTLVGAWPIHSCFCSGWQALGS